MSSEVVSLPLWQPPTVHVTLVKSLVYGRSRRLCLAIEKCRRSGLWISSWVWNGDNNNFCFADRVKSIIESPEGYFFVADSARLAAKDELGQEFVQRNPDSWDLDFVPSKQKLQPE